MPKTVKVLSEQLQDNTNPELSAEEQKKIALRVGTALFAGGLLAAGELHHFFYPAYESITGLIYLTGAIIAGAPVFRKALQGLVSHTPQNIMEQLVSLALLASIAKGDYRTAILIPLIMLLVHFLEEKSILGAKSAIEGLKTLQARDSCLITDRGEETVSTESLVYGDIIRIKPGDMIPVDGVVVAGNSTVNQSSLTGETIPSDISVNDKVYAGTVNIQGILEVFVLKKSNETSLSQIVALLKKAEESKTDTMRIVEKYVSYYLPLIVMIALSVLFATQNMDRAIAILVVSCPCAQVLISPTAMVAALAVASRNGILLKNSKFLEILGDAKTIIFDKTGTLTVGNLDVVGFEPSEGVAENDLLRTAAVAAWASSHPVSRAIVKAAAGLEFEKPSQAKESSGFGVTAAASSGNIGIGNRKWFLANGLALPDEPVHYGPVVWVEQNNSVLGCIMLADFLRADAKAAMQELRELGVNRMVLVTGDRKDATDVIKDGLCLDDAYCECLPADKLKILEDEKKEEAPVLVIGDGINDALALVKADVGVSMGAMGSDIAVQSSDIALMGNELQKLPFIIKLSRKTKKIIFQNMLIATISSALMITMAGIGIIDALTGSFLHNIGAFFVLLNSSRLLQFDNHLSDD